MPDEDSLPTKARHIPWNKGKLIGAKPPLRPNQVCSIRTRLLIGRPTRDLAPFNLAIDRKLRGCDVVTLKIEDVAPNGYAVDRATVRQKKTGRPVKFELTDQTRQAVDDFMKEAGKRPGEYLFIGRRGRDRAVTTRQYARLFANWVASIGLDPRVFEHPLPAPDQGNANNANSRSDHDYCSTSGGRISRSVFAWRADH